MKPGADTKYNSNRILPQLSGRINIHPSWISGGAEMERYKDRATLKIDAPHAAMVQPEVRTDFLHCVSAAGTGLLYRIVLIGISVGKRQG